MKPALIALNILLFLSGYSQNNYLKSYGELRTEKRIDCLSSDTKTKVDTGIIYAHWLSDTLMRSLDTANFIENDNTRIFYHKSSLLAPLFRNGILNAEILQNAGIRGSNYATLFDDYGMEKQFLNLKLEPDCWNGCCIFISETEIIQLRKDTKRVFEFGISSSSHSSISIYYLELQNMAADKNTTTKDFTKNASISCLVKWYAII